MNPDLAGDLARVSDASQRAAAAAIFDRRDALVDAVGELCDLGITALHIACLSWAGAVAKRVTGRTPDPNNPPAQMIGLDLVDEDGRPLDLDAITSDEDKAQLTAVRMIAACANNDLDTADALFRACHKAAVAEDNEDHMINLVLALLYNLRVVVNAQAAAAAMDPPPANPH